MGHAGREGAAKALAREKEDAPDPRMDSNRGGEMKTAIVTCWRCDKKFQSTVEEFASFPSECPSCLKMIEERNLKGAQLRSGQKLSVDDYIAAITPCIFQKTNFLKLPHDQFQAVMRWEVGPRGLLLVGESGKCKTRCLWALAHQLIRKNHQVEFLSELEFSHQVAKRGHIGTLWAWVEKLAEVEVLILDDLGKAPRTDRFVSELFYVIDKRVNEERPILISTQLDGSAVASQADRGVHVGGHTASALVRRLRECCEVIKF